VGESGSRIKKEVLNAMSEGLIDFVASDLHFGRRVCMKKAYRAVRARLGKAIADDVFINNANEFLLNK
jgi:tyrosine-protein phosphatase YwqE